MSTINEIQVLARAFVQRLVTVEEIPDLLRELNRDDAPSISGLLKSRGVLSDDQLYALLTRREGTANPAAALPPISGVSHPSNKQGGRSSTVKSDHTAVTRDFTPADGVDDRVARPGRNGNGEQPAGAQANEFESRQQYVMLTELGRGGLGRVRLAYDRQIGRDVAIKDLLPRSLRSTDKVNRFIREAQITGQLEHPGIVPIYATGLDQDGNPFYAMKRYAGNTYSRAIRDYHKLPHDSQHRVLRFNELLTAFVNICHTMAFAHRRGVLHRDLKPQNVIVGEFGETIVVDWGLAKIVRDIQCLDPDESTVILDDVEETPTPIIDPSIEVETRDGAIVGTLAYMSPEQADGAATDARSDIYALGAILYELLVGQAPFRGKAREVLDRIKAGEIRPPQTVAAHVPRALAEVCQKALARLPENRYTTAKDLADEVVRWQSGEPVLAFPEPWLDRGYRWLRRNRTTCLTTAAALLAFAAVFGAWSWQEDRRVDNLATRAKALERSAQRAFVEHDLRGALDQLDQAQAILSGERALAHTLTDIGKLRTQIQGALNVQLATEHQQQQLTQFAEAYDEALFRSLLSARPGSVVDHAQAIAATDRALSLFPIAHRSPAAFQKTANYLSVKEHQDIASKQQELMLVRADLAAQRPDDGELAAHAAEALQLLDQVPAQPILRAVAARRARYLAQAGRQADATAARKLAESTPTANALDLFLLGDEHFGAQRFAAAGNCFELALQREPDRFWAQYFQAAAQLQSSRNHEAIASLTACASRRPRFAWIYLLRGLAFGELGNVDSAEADFEKALSLADPRQPQDRYAIHLNRGIVRLRTNRLAAAINDFRDAQQIDGQRFEAFVNMAEANRVAELRQVEVANLALSILSPILPVRFVADGHEAIAQLDTAIRQSPREPRPLISRGRIYQQQGNILPALADFRQALNVSPPGTLARAQALCEMGRVLHSQGDPAGALRHYDLALRERDDYPEVAYLRGLALVDLNADREAVAALDKFLHGSSLLSQVYRPEGMEPAFAGRHGPVVESSLSQVGGIDPRSRLAAIYRERALARLKLHDLSGGLSDAAQALDLYSDHSPAFGPADHNRFANLHARRGWALLLENAELARSSFAEAIRLAPANGDPYAGRGWAEVQLRHYDLALNDAETALKKGPTSPGLLYNVACIYAAAVPSQGVDQADGNPERATQCTAEALRLLRECFAALPAGQRAAYLTAFATDSAFDSVRHLPETQQLMAELGQTAGDRKP